MRKVTSNTVFHFSGLEADKKAFFKQAKTEITYAKDGDVWTITVGMQGKDHIPFSFKLGDPYDSISLDGSKLKVKKQRLSSLIPFITFNPSGAFTCKRWLLCREVMILLLIFLQIV